MLTKVSSCLRRLEEDIKQANGMPPGTNRSKRLVELRVEFKRLAGRLPDRWLAPKTDASVWSSVADARASAEQTLIGALRPSGLYSKFSGVLVSGFALANSDDASTPAASATSTTGIAASEPAAKGSDLATTGVGNILWQSRHFGEQSLRKVDVDLSIGGRLGMQPVLTIVKPAATGATASAESATPTTTHQNAFVWSAGLQAHVPLETIDAELGAYGSLGSALLTTVPKVLGSGSSAQLALPLNAKSDANAWRWESGLTFDVFDNDLNQIHAEAGTLTPLFQALVAWRRDDRFSGVTAFKGPTDRLLFRLTLDAIRVFDKRQIGEAAKTYTVSFVVEKERAWGRGANRLPSAMRYLVRGDIDLLNAVAPAAAAAAAKSEAAPSIAWTAALPGPQVLAVGKAARVTIALNALTTSDKQSVKATPAPTVEVTAEKPGTFAVPICPGASIALALADGTVRLTTTGWTDCRMISADVAVTAPAAAPSK